MREEKNNKNNNQIRITAVKTKDVTTTTTHTLQKAQHHHALPYARYVGDDRVNIEMIYLRVFQISIDDNSVVK